MAKFNPKWEINLTTLANSNLDSKVARKVRPTLKTTDFKTLFVNRVIDEVVRRTQGGVDKNTRVFSAYSKSYRTSEVFHIYKSDNQRVPDLTLTGSMLASLDSKLSGDTIIIYFNDSNDAAKAHGHINGTKTLPKRDFFGLPKNELNKIFKKSVKDYRSGERDESEETTAKDILELNEDA